MKKISIITVNYNDSEGLEKTLGSIGKQTGISKESVELIIVDGGSTDNSVEVIKRFQCNKLLPIDFPHWVSESDSGIYNAMNKGINLSTGRYLLFLNSGDWLASSTTLMNFLVYTENREEKIYYGNDILCGKNRYMMRNAQLISEKQMGFCHQAVFTPSSFFANRLYNEKFKIVADFDFYLEMFKTGKKFEMLDFVISVYDGTGISSTNREGVIKEMNEIYAKYGLPLVKENITFVMRIKKIIKLLLPKKLAFYISHTKNKGWLTKKELLYQYCSTKDFLDLV